MAVIAKIQNVFFKYSLDSSLYMMLLQRILLVKISKCNEIIFVDIYF